MTKRNLPFSLAGSAIVCLLLVGAGQAAVPRAFVSISGTDSNPCSAGQPCRSFNQALTVVQPGGEIVVQDSGGYSTGFTITQSVTIDAAGVNASVISIDGSDLCTVNAGPTDRIVLRGISFHGANVGGSAINVTQAGSLWVGPPSIDCLRITVEPSVSTAYIRRLPSGVHFTQVPEKACPAQFSWTAVNLQRARLEAVVRTHSC